MTLVVVGDKIVTVPLRTGGRVPIRSGDIQVGDKVVLIPGRNGERYAIKIASPEIDDKVVLYPLRTGGHVCLASVDNAEGGSDPVPGLISFDVVRQSLYIVQLNWDLGDCTEIRVMRLTDRYPTTIVDGVLAYEGSAAYYDDNALDYGNAYWYSAWGKIGTHYSTEYLTAWVGSLYGISFWSLFVFTRSTAYNTYGGGLIDTDIRPDGCTGISKELYFLKNAWATPSWARATATIIKPYARLKGWIGISSGWDAEHVRQASGIRVRVNGSIVWQKTEPQFGEPGIHWIQVDIALAGGNLISNFVLQFERYHNLSLHVRFSGFFCGMHLTWS